MPPIPLLNVTAVKGCFFLLKIISIPLWSTLLTQIMKWIAEQEILIKFSYRKSKPVLTNYFSKLREKYAMRFECISVSDEFLNVSLD